MNLRQRLTALALARPSYASSTLHYTETVKTLKRFNWSHTSAWEVYCLGQPGHGLSTDSTHRSTATGTGSIHILHIFS